MQTETIHNIPYVNSNLTSFIDYLEKHYIDQKIGAVISTVNPEIAFAAIKDRLLKEDVGIRLLTQTRETISQSA